MADEFISISGDLLFERRKLSDSLKRLERLITGSGISRALRTEALLKLQSELDDIMDGVDRLESLAKTLNRQVQSDHYVSCETFLIQALKDTQEIADVLKRSVFLKAVGHKSLADKDTLKKLQNIFKDILSIFLEFCVENPRERVLRKKKESAVIQIECKKLDDGVRLTLIADGNGMMPPLMEEHGVRLAQLGVRGTFEGKVGKWSCWSLYIPDLHAMRRCIAIKIRGRSVYIPAWSIVREVSVSDLQTEIITVRLDEDLNREHLKEKATLPYKKIYVGAGTRTVLLLADEISEVQDVFVKPLSEIFTSAGRFLGVVVETEKKSEMLNVIMNPAYLVYGSFQSVEATHEA